MIKIPINLSHEAIAAKERYKNATTLPEKIRTLQEYLSAIPDHKGTEKLRARLKSKLSKLKEEAEEERLRKKGTGIQFYLKKEGDAQVTLVGLANSGKSSLLAALTSATPEISVRPFTTKKLTPGMIDFEGVQIQAVEVPAIFEGASKSGIGRQSLGAIRNADLVIVVIDLMRDPIEQLKLILKEFEHTGIKLNETPPPVEIKKTGLGGIQIIGDVHLEAEKSDVIELLFDHGIHNAVVTISGEIKLEDIAEALDRSIIYLPGIIVCTKGDVKGSADNFNKLKNSAFEKQFHIIPTSVINEAGMKNAETLPAMIFQKLNLIRIYTKDEAGIAKRPVVLSKGVTVKELTKILHKHFFQRFKYAKVWGNSVKHSGSTVGFSHMLEDGDVIQVYTS